MKADHLTEDMGVATNTATSPHRSIYGQTSGWDTETWFPQRPAWQAQGACVGMDPDLFHPARGDSTSEAKEVCRGCPVRDDCREYALVNREKFGIWGGLSERERRRLRRTRGRAA